MRNRILPAGLLAGLFVFSTGSFFAQQQSARLSIEILTTFDYPGEGNSTRPQKINDAGDIAGDFTDSSGVTRGFVRFRDGSFSAPIVEPDGDGSVTQARGINNLGVVCGYFLNGNAHSFFLSGATFTQFDVAGAFNTYLHAINEAGDFAGVFDTIAQSGQGYVSIGGSIVAFTIPGALVTSAFGINNSDQTAGEYTDSTSILHGFFRDADGTLTFPIDPPGATATILFGINDSHRMVGRFADGSGVTHALLFQLPNKFLVYDFPGETFTSFNGINRQGVICGRYEDSSGIGHGIIARVKRGAAGATGTATRGGEQSAPVKRVIPLRSAPREAAPAS